MKQSLTRILAELKLLDKKIEKSSQEQFVGIYQRRGGGIIGTTLTKEIFETNVKSGFDSLKGLIDRKVQLKSALATANATTKVTVAGKVYTIAEAIALKTSIMPTKVALRDQLQRQINSIERSVETQRQKLDNGIEEMLKANLGKDRKASKEDYDILAKPFFEGNEYLVSDVADIRTYLKTLQEEIDTFQSEVDMVLSEVNSKTEVEV